MSVIVRGMDMPKNCFECPCCTLGYCRVDVKTTEYAKYVFSDGQDGRHPDCPLVEIPTPHGRLIDADEFIRELASEHVGGLDAIKKYTDADTWTSGLHTAWRLIDDASTVIEAEGETE